KEQLRREDVRVARPAREHSAEKRFGASARVHVRRVVEVDPDVERFRDARLRLLALDAAAVREPRAEADLGNVEVGRAELPVAHHGSLTIPGRAYASPWRGRTGGHGR